MKKTMYFLATGTALLFLHNCASYVPPVPPVQIIESTPGITNSAKELTRITDNAIAEFAPVVSPNGKKILYYAYDNTKTGGEAYSIYMKEIGKPGTVPLTSGFTYNPAWSRNNNEYYYTYTKPTKSLLAKSKIDGMGITYVSPNALGESDNNANLSLNPKQNKVLFNTKVGSTTHICVMDDNGMNFTLLVEGENPVWHPKENEILYNKKVGDYYHLFSYNMENGQITQVTSGNTVNIHPNYSPDGRHITYTSNMDGQEYHIYIMSVSGSNPMQLTTGNVRNTNPFWGADGYIYFQSNAGTENYDAKTPWKHSDIWRLRPVLN